MSALVMEFTAHLDGRNAYVQIWPDRLEWSRKPLVGGAAKAGIAVITGGASLLFKAGRSSKRESDVIPLKAITAVSTFRNGIGWTGVKVTTMTNVLEFGRMPAARADEVQRRLLDLMAGPAPAPAPVPTAAPPSSVADELKKLAELRDAGVLSGDEFEEQKASLLSR